MAEEAGQEKSEQPTAKRLQDARERGEIPRSKELATTILLLAAAGAMLVLGEQLARALERMMAYNFTLDRQAVFDTSRMFAHLWASLYEALWGTAGIFLLILIAAIVGPIALGGWNFSGKAIAPKLSRINPLSGIARMFSLKALVELGKALAKFLLVGSLSVVILLAVEDDLLQIGAQATRPAMLHGLEVLGWSFLMMSATLIVIALVDVPFQLHDYTKKLKMTLQEVKDEMKNTEGKPEVKGRIRQLQREMAQRRMMAAVPEADVVITNPTHFAVALTYDQDGTGAPLLVAKGADLIAFKIREIADAHAVPVLSAPPLARAIFFSTELEEEIPAGLYMAVAQVLAYVFQLKSYQERRGQRPDLPTDLPIPPEYQRPPES